MPRFRLPWAGLYSATDPSLLDSAFCWNSASVSATATAAVTSDQSNTATSSAAIVPLAGDAISDSALNVSGNSLLTTASGNNAVNGIVADVGAAYCTPGLSTFAGVSGVALSSNADFAVLDRQSNTGALNSTINPGGANPIFIGVNLSGAQTITGGTSSVLNNDALAMASGNMATNQIAMSHTPGSSATSAVANFQSNTAGVILATVDNVTIGLAANGISGATTVSGNRIGATAIGNSAVNVITTLP